MKLSNVALAVQKLVKLLIAFVIVYYVFILVLIPTGKGILKAILPPRYKPNPIYGLIDAPSFVSKTILNSNSTYTLNTQNGKLPENLQTIMSIYRERTPQFSYEAGKTAQTDAASLGFTDADIISDLRGTTYRWLNSSTQSYLEIQIENKDLVQNTPMSGKSDQYIPGTITAANAVTTAKGVLNSIKRFDEDTYGNATTTTVVTLGRVSAAGALPTLAPEEAEFARVDFFRSVGQNLVTRQPFPILGPDAKKGLLSVVVAKRDENKTTPLQNPFMSVYYKEIETTTDATYPIIPVQDAWNIVSAGKGIISDVTPRNANPFVDYTPVRVDNILVNNIYLAYYESSVFNKYLYPVYVFEGNYTSTDGGSGSITIYYPALSAESIKPAVNSKPSPTTQPK